jgi:hypothetical protein
MSQNSLLIKAFLVNSGMAIAPNSADLTAEEMTVWSGFLNHSEGLEPHRVNDTLVTFEGLSESLVATLTGQEMPAISLPPEPEETSQESESTTEDEKGESALDENPINESASEESIPDEDEASDLENEESDEE